MSWTRTFVRILCVNYEYPPIGGGGGVACKGLAESLVNLGHRIEVVTSGMNDLPARENCGGVEIHRVPCWRRHRHYVTEMEMATQIAPAYREALALHAEQPSFDLNHTHFIVPSGIASYRLWRRTGLPYVITVHGSDVPGYNPDRFRLSHLLIRPLWKRVVRHARGLIAPSRFLKEIVEHHIGNVTVDVVPHAIEFPAISERPRNNRILVVSRMFPRKGIQYLLEAVDSLDPAWEVHIAGDGPYLPTLRQQAAAQSRQIKFWGFLHRERLWELYQSAKIFVFPSIRENLPVVLYEAMAAGCAVVTTTAPGCAEAVGDAALKVQPASAKALRQALNQLIADEDRIAQLSREGRQRVASVLPQTVAKAHEEIFSRYVS